MTTPTAVLIAGPNGAGKTTFARQFIPLLHPGVPFLNADEIQRESIRFATAAGAARELLARLDAAERAAESFAIETTLASRSYVPRLRRWSELGFRTVLHFIELPSADFAVQRVLARVAAGGHPIPEEDVRRRFDRGKRLFLELYKARTIGSVMKPASDSSTSVPAPEADELDLLLEAARRATWDAKHGPTHLRSGRFFIATNLSAHASSRLLSAESSEKQQGSNIPVRGRLTQR